MFVMYDLFFYFSFYFSIYVNINYIIILGVVGDSDLIKIRKPYTNF
jgi:hypothetical protein